MFFVCSNSTFSHLLCLQLAKKKNVTEFERVLLRHPDRLNTRDPKGQTPLHLAVSEGNTIMVDFILGQPDGEI